MDGVETMQSMKGVETMQSPEINELVRALVKVQGVIGPAVKSSENPYFKSKYADFKSVVDACRKELAANGLATIQTTAPHEDMIVIVTTLAHESGQWIRGKLALRPVKTDPQAYGSAITYGRRYALAAIVGVVTDDDDDGNAASKLNGTKEPDVVSEFLEVQTFMAENGRADFYVPLMTNSKGAYPTVDQIKIWKTPKQIAFLRSVVEKLKIEKAAMLSALREEMEAAQ